MIKKGPVQLIIFGKASQKILASMILTEEHHQKTILELAEALKIPIASSCGGEGICRKCLINTHVLSCQLTVAEALRRDTAQQDTNIVISVDYL